LVSHTEGRTQIEGVPEQGAERIFGPKMEEVVGGWRRLHNEELHNLLRFAEYYLGDQINDDEVGGACRNHER
jgi:hypothetical protein